MHYQLLYGEVMSLRTAIILFFIASLIVGFDTYVYDGLASYPQRARREAVAFLVLVEVIALMFTTRLVPYIEVRKRLSQEEL
jgi:hypothetical protein